MLRTPITKRTWSTIRNWNWWR